MGDLELVHRDWRGDVIKARVLRACARGVLAIGENSVVWAKKLAHVQTGTMRRSIHTAPLRHTGDGDEEGSVAGDLPNATMVDVQISDLGAIIMIGSWVPYACVEETGRGHQFITPAVELARPMATPILKKAFMEEGLTETGRVTR